MSACGRQYAFTHLIGKLTLNYCNVAYVERPRNWCSRPRAVTRACLAGFSIAATREPCHGIARWPWHRTDRPCVRCAGGAS